MHRLTYVSARGDEVALDGPGAYVGTAPDLRGRSWSYTLGYRALTGVSRETREVSLNARFFDPSQANTLRRAADRDVYDGTPGELVVGTPSERASGAGWRQRAYIVKSEPDTVTRSAASAKLTCVLLDGAWRRAHTLRFNRGGSLTDGKGYPHGYPYSYGTAEGITRISSVGTMPGPVSLTVYGPATSPSVKVGGNVFSVDCSVPSGGYLVVDGVDLTVTLVNGYGERENRLADAVRGTGKGSGQYIFEQVGGNGDVPVSWDGAFGFDLTWWEQEGEPPWSER